MVLLSPSDLLEDDEGANYVLHIGDKDESDFIYIMLFSLHVEQLVE